jgi:membrane-bound metal-dependent hydrolase YbcI (DUF457 family)
MFIGHFAVGLASKKIAPRASLLPLLAAPLLLDLLWPLFLLAGWERVRIVPGDTAFTPLEFVSYPISHSLLAACGWALLFALAYLAASRYPRGAWVVAAGVLSHWFLDALTHRPDMPLYPGGPRVGLGLWNSVPLTLMVESLMFAGGVWAYLSATRAEDRAGKYGFWLFILTVLLIYVGAARGTPPPGVRAVALVACGAWLFPFWAGWADRHRAPRSVTDPGFRGFTPRRRAW